MDIMLTRISVIIGFIVLFSAGVISGRFILLEEYAWISFWAVLLGAMPSLYFYARDHGNIRAWQTLLPLAVFALLFESFAIYTGFPYGYFTYSDGLGPKFLNLAPWCVPFAWIPLVLLSGSLASCFVSSKTKRVLIGTFVLVVADMVVDPVATKMGLWVWRDYGMYYGIPILNFCGWIFSGMIGMIIFTFCCKKQLTCRSFFHYSLSALMSLAYFSGVALYFRMWIPMLLGIVFVATGLIVKNNVHE